MSLSSTQQRLLNLYRRHGSRGPVVAVTLLSVATSLFVTSIVMTMVVDLDSAEPGTLEVSLLIAGGIPLVVAPLSVRVITDLLARLDQAYLQVAALSVTDPLTGVANRRGFFGHAANALVDENQDEVVLAGMLDLDKFKQLNDQHGHHAGDQALLRVAELLREAVEPYGLVGRMGGDEFAFLAAGTPAEMGALEHVVRDRCSSFTVGTELAVRASLGVSSPQDGDNIDTLLARADSDLYRAKAARSTGLINARIARETGTVVLEQGAVGSGGHARHGSREPRY